jgi:arabinose-5-phosphate isomerase
MRKENRFKQTSTVLETGRRVLRIESEAVAALSERLDQSFQEAVDLVLNCRGRIIVTGIGKSGIVAKKIAATLTSTGTAALFLHPADGLHGDLGIVLKDDVVICVSKSGNTAEITQLIPMFEKIGVPILTITGNPKSAIAGRSRVVLNVSVRKEACPNNLAPTASTTAAIAMGDALAVALLERRNFRPEDFAFLHPGGSLGRELLKIDDIMFSGEKIPRVFLNDPFKTVVLEISGKRFGCTCVVDEENKLLGIITDGDLRRLMKNPADLTTKSAGQIMNSRPIVIQPGCSVRDALVLLENYNIMQVVVVDGNGSVVGMVHLHDILETGIGAT